MAPRNDNAGSSFKKGNDSDTDVNHIVPCILHKKHKVVKLIRGQLENINQDGIFTDDPSGDAEIFRVDATSPILMGTRRTAEEEDMNSGSSTSSKNHMILFSILLILLLIFALIILMIWISAGPLSNTIPHTPILYSAFIRSECLCSLEKKYLLRWSKPEYFE